MLYALASENIVQEKGTSQFFTSGQGGIVIAKDRVINYLHLPFAGILSTESAYEVDEKLKELHSMLKKMGCKLDAPFIQMSFLSLPVIPSLKITDKGLVDVDAFKIIPVLTGNQGIFISADFQDQ